MKISFKHLTGRIITLLATSCLLTACQSIHGGPLTVGPDYQPPTNDSPAAYKSGNSGNLSHEKLLERIQLQAWWMIYQDGQLDELETKLLNQNQTLKAAFSRLNQARATARVDRSFLLPTVDAHGVWTRYHTSEENKIGPPNATFNQIGTPLDLSYEVDLWGRVRRSFEAGRAEAQASDADYYGLLLTQSSDLAEDYFTLRSLDEQITDQTQIVKDRIYEVELQAELRSNGISSETELNSQKVPLDAAKANLAGLQLRRENLENAIAVLAGENPSIFHLAKLADNQWNPVVPAIPAGLPSELLKRRPDISSAERTLAAANARIGVAKAAFFPVVTLTGSGGYLSAGADSLFNWTSHDWSFGPSVSLPIFLGGRNHAELSRAKAVYAETLAQYREKVLIAYSEVENSLNAMQRVSEQKDSARNTVIEFTANLALSLKRQEAGLADQMEVLEFNQGCSAAKVQLSQLTSQQLITTIETIKALGGGWDDPKEYQAL